MITVLEVGKAKIKAFIDLVFGKPSHCVLMWWRGEQVPLSLLLLSRL